MFDFLRGIFPGQTQPTSQQIGGIGAPAPPSAPVLSNPANVATPVVTAQPTVGPTGPIAGADAAAPQGWFGKIGGIEGLGSIAQGIASLGNLYGAIQGIGIARDQLRLSKRAFETNLTNQTQSYNTALEDRIRSRYAAEGRNTSEADEYLKKHSL